MPPLELIGVKAVLFKFPFTSWTWFGLYFMSLVTTCHRRRIELEDKAKVTVELNRLFQKDRGNTASAARILSPNPTRRPLPCLLIQSFFYATCSIVTTKLMVFKLSAKHIDGKPFDGGLGVEKCTGIFWGKIQVYSKKEKRPVIPILSNGRGKL